MAFCFNFQTTLSHLHPLLGANCDINSRLVVDEGEYGKFRLERVRYEYCVWTVMPYLDFLENSGRTGEIFIQSIYELFDYCERFIFFSMFYASFSIQFNSH